MLKTASILTAALAAAALVAACGDDGNSTPDAPKTIDAPLGNAAQPVACDGTEAATIMTTNGVFMFQPDTATITVGQVVKFTMGSTHAVVADTTDGDAGLSANFGDQNRCLKFVRAGTFKFHCPAHAQMHGTITVNPS